MMFRATLGSILLPLLLLAASCSPHKSHDGQPKAAAAAAISEPEFQGALDKSLQSIIDRNFTGDFDALIARRVIRVAVPFNRTFYFVDNGVQRGFSYEYVKLFEEELNKKLKAGGLAVDVVLLPFSRDMLLPALNDGRVDMVVAQLTITPDR